jgi:peptidoglycan/LPS O-acetylase OafA/YrhL
MQIVGKMAGKMNQNDRAYYLDWIRIGVILLLVPFHSAITFTARGDGFIRYPQSVPVMDIGLWFLSIWIMPVLFVVSGVASYHALQYRTRREYLRERRAKLLIPFLAGLLLVCPPMAYLRALFMGSFEGSLLQFYPHFFTGGVYPKGYFNWGHLWFLIYLYVFTLILLPLFMRMMRERTRALVVTASAILEKGMWIYLAAIPLMFTQTVLSPFFPGHYNLFWDWAYFTLYLGLVLYGFLFAINDRILDNIQRIRMVSLGLAILLFVPEAFLRISGMGTALGPISPAYNVLILFASVFAALGYARQFLNQPYRFYHYLHNASFPFYILHFFPITVASYFIARSDLNVWLKYPIIVVFAYPSTLALYEIIRRVPVVGSLFGIKPFEEGILKRDVRAERA